MLARTAPLAPLALLVGALLAPMVAVERAGAQTPPPSAGRAPYVRLSVPRIPPVDPHDFTAEQKAAAGDGGTNNLQIRTALREPELAKQWWSWLVFAWDAEKRPGAALPFYDKELVILRTNWLCHDDWVWSAHVGIARRNGRSDADIAKIPKGVAAGGWSEKDAALLTAVDELHYDSVISDATWRTLAKHLNTKQLLDLLFTVGNYHTNAFYTNNVGMALSPGAVGLPKDVPAPAARGRTPYVRLTTPRITPVEARDYTAEQKAAIGDNPSPNLNLRTALYEPELGKRWWTWLAFAWDAAKRPGAALPFYDKELVILRTNWLCHDDWVWSAHVPIAKRNGRSDADIAKIPAGLAAGGWSEKDAALLAATDEPHAEAFISAATWAQLSKHLDTRQLLDLLFTAGNYHTNAFYTNSVGMPLSPGAVGLPR